MEKSAAGFPRHGKNFRWFSTLWKTFFHTVENPEPPHHILKIIG